MKPVGKALKPVGKGLESVGKSFKYALIDPWVDYGERIADNPDRLIELGKKYIVDPYNDINEKVTDGVEYVFGGDLEDDVKGLPDDWKDFKKCYDDWVEAGKNGTREEESQHSVFKACL